MSCRLQPTGVRADVGNIWKTAPSLLNKIGGMCRQTVSSILAISFNKKLYKDCWGFWYLFWNYEKVETGHFSGGDNEKGNRIKMVEISFLSKDSLLL